MELSAELIGRDGSSRPLRVTCEEGTLRGVLRGLERLQGALSTEMTELVEREKGSGAAHNPDNEDEEGGDDDDDDDDDDDEDSLKNGTVPSSPPAKRNKTRQN
ncbi:EKC/KEOPS complex subunit GON7-like isoform X2 [Hyla sarda]|uniref:EKC/KEOPS complex subunit GON7-like isoform X2 n=1 Tax=Hyla sarda TaxID=327740 RepID=UPI0024C41525|nr:EKC/KEOPS complex subunit GON7-like isoform X2 [Hyla sarda]